MSQISFMPYFPNRFVDSKYANVHLWNWHRHKNDYIDDVGTLAFLDRYFQMYKRSDGKLEERIAIIETTKQGASASVQGVPREVEQFASVAMLAHLSRLPADPDQGFFASTSDNFIAFHQLFDPGRPEVSVEFGSYLKTHWIAGSIDRLTLLTPQHVPGVDHGVCDEKMLGYLAEICGQQNSEVERLFRALDWIGFAFSNSHGHLYASRLVAMATAFEIMLDLPEEKKGQEFAGRMNARLLPNRLPLRSRTLGSRTRKPKAVTDNVIGWWCRDFYTLRSKIVHGEMLQNTDYFTNNVENLKIALYLFCECVDDLLVKLQVMSQANRATHFWWYQQDLLTALAINRTDFY